LSARRLASNHPQENSSDEIQTLLTYHTKRSDAIENHTEKKICISLPQIKQPPPNTNSRGPYKIIYHKNTQGFVEGTPSRVLWAAVGMFYFVKPHRPQDYCAGSIAERAAYACNLCTAGGLPGWPEYVYIGAG
jgi:hypothetical protein